MRCKWCGVYGDFAYVCEGCATGRKPEVESNMRPYRPRSYTKHVALAEAMLRYKSQF